MNRLRVAVVGVGHLGRIHARIARDQPEIELIAVVDPDRASRQAVAEELNVRPGECIREVAESIDAAIVATPTVFHHAVGVELAQRGIHLFVEKPIAAELAQADELVEACRSRNLVLQVGHVERFNPALRAVLPHLDDPKYIEAVRVSGYSFRSADIGVVLDLMIHDLDVALSMVGATVRQVDALGAAVLGGGHEDVAQARITFDNGCVANFTASRVSYSAKRNMQVWTSESCANIDFAANQATVARRSRQLIDGSLDLSAVQGEEKLRLKDQFFNECLVRETIDADPVNAIAEEQREFVASIRAARPARVSGEQGRDALALAEQILESIAEHAWDGTDQGRQGPHATPPAPILRDPRWSPAPNRRQAG